MARSMACRVSRDDSAPARGSSTGHRKQQLQVLGILGKRLLIALAGFIRFPFLHVEERETSYRSEVVRLQFERLLEICPGVLQVAHADIDGGFEVVRHRVLRLFRFERFYRGERLVERALPQKAGDKREVSL